MERIRSGAGSLVNDRLVTSMARLQSFRHTTIVTYRGET